MPYNKTKATKLNQSFLYRILSNRDTYLNRSIWHIERIVKDATTSGQNEPESNCNERVLLTTQLPEKEPHETRYSSVL